MKTKDKEYNYNIIVLAYCSAFTHFMAAQQNTIIYPSERICSLAVSVLLSFVLAKFVNNISFDIVLIKLSAGILLLSRLIYTVYRYTRYHRIFYGSDTVGIILLTVAIAVFLIMNADNNVMSIYSFAVISNVMIIVLLLILSADKLDAANIYSTYLQSDFSFETVMVFFDVFTIAVFSKNKKERACMQNRFLFVVFVVFMIIIMLQGMCIKGDLLYGISPLQALVQIFTGKTVKRFDYIFDIMFAINYFAAVILYISAMIKLFCKEKSIEKG